MSDKVIDLDKARERLRSPNSQLDYDEELLWAEEAMSSVEAEINESFGPVPFDSNILKEILKANRDYHSGEVRIFKGGMIDLHMHCGGPLYTGYYLVRKQENN